jgi:Glyoxalase-like domain
MHHVVLDCPDPAVLSNFCSALLGLPVTYRDDDWVVVAVSDASSGLAFQRAPDHQPPTWPGPAVPQQVHLDIKTPEPGQRVARSASGYTPPGILGGRCRSDKAWMLQPRRPGYMSGASTSYPRAA